MSGLMLKLEDFPAHVQEQFKAQMEKANAQRRNEVIAMMAQAMCGLCNAVFFEDRIGAANACLFGAIRLLNDQTETPYTDEALDRTNKAMVDVEAILAEITSRSRAEAVEQKKLNAENKTVAN